MASATLPPQIEIEAEARKRFSRSEVEKMADLGIFEGQRIELIDGDLINKREQKPPHASVIRRLLKVLAQLFEMDRILVQTPVDVSPLDQEKNLPEPDLAVLIENKPDFDVRHPQGSELLIAIEVAYSSQYRDVTTKRDLYARAGVPEYWVIDLLGRQVIVHRALKEGEYTKISAFSENESVALETQPGKPIAVAALLPSA